MSIYQKVIFLIKNFKKINIK